MKGKKHNNRAVHCHPIRGMSSPAKLDDTSKENENDQEEIANVESESSDEDTNKDEDDENGKRKEFLKDDKAAGAQTVEKKKRPKRTRGSPENSATKERDAKAKKGR